MEQNNKIILFQEKQIRRIWDDNQWQKRGLKEGTEYAILTAEIAKATFDLTPVEHKNLKGLQRYTNTPLIWKYYQDFVNCNLKLKNKLIKCQ